MKRNKGSNRIRQRGRREKREHGRADGRERARAHEAEADAVLSRLVRGLHILLTVHGAGASPGYGPLGQNSPCCLVCCFVCCFCCLVCWSVCPSFIGHPTRVRFPVLSTGPLPTTFPLYHPLHTSFSPFYRAVVLLWSTSPR